MKNFTKYFHIVRAYIIYSNNNSFKLRSMTYKLLQTVNSFNIHDAIYDWPIL